MRDEMANLAYPVFTHALRVRDRLELGEHLDFNTVQFELKNLLRPRSEAERWPEYGGDGDRWLGARFALTCWLDELFILDSPWSDKWTENSLEYPLFQTERERAWKFWHQAKLAQARPGTDALEVFYLCVMLGFRGEGPEPPETVETWKDAVEAQIAKNQQREWPGPQELHPELEATPRRAKGRLQSMILLILAVLALLIPTATYLLVSMFKD